MFATEPKTVTAKKRHICTNCGEYIEPGEKYEKWASFDDSACTNKMHPECLASFRDGHGSGYWEYTLYGGERPDADSADALMRL